MLITIDQYGSPIPFYDEWEAEAAWLYKLHIEGNLGFGELFEPHNGHRVVLTRITALFLFVLNGGWEPQLQLIVNSILHASTAAILVLLVQNYVRFDFQSWAALATVLLFSVPFSWLSILVPFQTQFYFMLFFAVLSMSQLSAERYVSGYLFAILSLLSMTSGAFVLPAFIATILLESIRNRSIARDQVIHIVICGVIFTAFLFTRAPDAGAVAYYAQNIKGFVITIIATISWPFRVSYGVGLIVYLPLALLALKACFGAKVPRIYLCLAMFMALHILAMGYFRGGEGVPPANRYWGILIVGIWLNGMAMLYLLDNYSNKYLKLIGGFWSIAIVIGMASLAYMALTEGLPDHKEQSLTAQTLIVQYLSSNDPAVLQDRTGLEISHPNADELIRILSDPTVQKILPSSLGGYSEDSLQSSRRLLLNMKWLIWISGLIFLAVGLRLSSGLRKISN